MIEKLKAVGNPLTIIAIFAGIAEISGTAVLPFITTEIQQTYFWFLIIFPTLLVVLFFVTLNFNNRVLYAPSDFREDESFFRTLTPQERRQKLEVEAKEVQAVPLADNEEPPLPMTPKETEQFIEAYTEAEDLVLRDLETEYGRHVKRNVAMDNYKGSIQFDAAITLRRALLVVEIKLVQKPQLNYAMFDQLREKSRTVHNVALQSGLYWSGSVMLVIVTTFTGASQIDYVQRLEKALRELDIHVVLRVYDFEALQRKHAQKVSEPFVAIGPR